ncbi:hypothetical protein QTO34_016991 [Cnephaeus nilssonii]|uniref:Uncharacterized protein n=1 Tax=Cnephaeus nilssonii TaxID=3371016 RepID=A0AA40I3A4_CNENI|nr:hypothetical protein QTO34_016991 [Eptesicus nilssonii]
MGPERKGQENNGRLGLASSCASLSLGPPLGLLISPTSLIRPVDRPGDADWHRNRPIRTKSGMLKRLDDKYKQLNDKYTQLNDKYTHLNENYKALNENVTDMKRNQEDMKNNIAAIKNTMEGLNTRLEEAEDCISELEDKSGSPQGQKATRRSGECNTPITSLLLSLPAAQASASPGYLSLWRHWAAEQPPSEACLCLGQALGAAAVQAANSPYEEEQLHKQTDPVRGIAAAYAVHSHPRSNSCLSNLARSEEQQPHKQTTHVRGAAALHSPKWSKEQQPHADCPCPTSSSWVRNPPPKEEQQLHVQLTPTQGAAATKAALPASKEQQL